MMLSAGSAWQGIARPHNAPVARISDESSSVRVVPTQNVPSGDPPVPPLRVAKFCSLGPSTKLAGCECEDVKTALRLSTSYILRTAHRRHAHAHTRDTIYCDYDSGRRADRPAACGVRGAWHERQSY
eukprot:scaffold27867_cov120-Isochrysis_galbana.AAC.7